MTKILLRLFKRFFRSWIEEPEVLEVEPVKTHEQIAAEVMRDWREQRQAGKRPTFPYNRWMP